MIKMKKGCQVPFPEKILEGYEILENRIIANVGVDKIEEVFQHFIKMHEEPLFFILELPGNAKEEEEVQPGVVEALHKDVYYLDGCSADDALAVLARAGQILSNDGLSSFGFGGHESGDEMMFTKYNVLMIYSRNLEKYKQFFEQHEIPEKKELLTAWDTFSEEHPGDSEIYEIDGRSVFNIPGEFESWGMYRAERREGEM